MTTKEKAPGSAATLTGAEAGKVGFGEAAISCSHCTTAPAQRQVPEDEIRRFCGSMRRRARAIWTSAANVEKAAGLSKCNPQLEGQIAIGGIGGGETNG